ncbi:hypothetical protein HDU86_001646 [Geranomyces michiganensis]|nr:hypothetical protein HDU86_001646 [Geranomyces michiganensis]
MRASSLFASAALACAATVYAAPVGDRHQMVLLTHQQVSLSANVPNTATEDKEHRLIALGGNECEWMTEEQIFDLIRAGKRFIDVTDNDIDFSTLPKTQVLGTALPAKPAHQSVIHPLLKEISEKQMEKWLTQLSEFRTRYFRTSTGKAASEHIFAEVSALADDANANRGMNVTVRPFTHSWGQSSVIARIEPPAAAAAKSGAVSPPEIVIVGAHLDSVNQWNPYFGRSPGADDDGSGSTTIFEAYRVLLAAGFAPSRPLEFHWYSAEEGGLLGSQKVVAAYKAANVPVLGMLQVDMTGYTPPNKKEILGIATDYINPALSKFLQSVAAEYCEVPWADTKCGYGCSDHASWTGAGYPSAFTFEAAFDDHSPYIHTADDSVDHINFAHAAEFSKLAMSFAVELSMAK